MLKWADGRACFGVVPRFVIDDWGIEQPKAAIAALVELVD